MDVTWHSFYTILVQFSSCSSGIPEISSISLLPCCSSWFLLTFSSSDSSWSSFSVLLMRVFFVFRFLFSASILAIWLPWVSSISAWKSCDFSMSIPILWLFYFFLLHAFYPGRKVVFFLLYYVQLFYLFFFWTIFFERPEKVFLSIEKVLEKDKWGPALMTLPYYFSPYFWDKEVLFLGITWQI